MIPQSDQILDDASENKAKEKVEDLRNWLKATSMRVNSFNPAACLAAKRAKQQPQPPLSSPSASSPSPIDQTVDSLSEDSPFSRKGQISLGRMAKHVKEEHLSLNSVIQYDQKSLRHVDLTQLENLKNEGEEHQCIVDFGLIERSNAGGDDLFPSPEARLLYYSYKRAILRELVAPKIVVKERPDPKNEVIDYKALVAMNRGKEYGTVVSWELEAYLSDQQFISVFGRDRDAFYGQPRWKRNDQKKRAHLF